MRKTTRKKRSRSSSDERLRKIVGIVILTISAYLLLAFISYLFTWKADHAAVASYGWGILFTDDVDVANWLGPLGAITAHTAFYYGFGLMSFLLVYLLSLVGLSVLQKQPIVKLQRQLRWGLIGLMGLSIMLSFTFQMFDFPVGGAYGYLVSSFLEGIIGVPGVLLLILLALVMLVVWIFNPDWSEVQSGSIWDRMTPNFALPSGLARFTTKKASTSKRRPSKSKSSTTEDDSYEVVETITANDDVDGSTEELSPLEGVEGLDLSEKEDVTLVFENKSEDKSDMFEGIDLTGDVPKITTPVTTQDSNVAMEVEYSREEEREESTVTQGSRPKGFDIKRGDDVRSKLSAEEEIEDTELLPYDPTLELSDYKYPELSLLKQYPGNKNPVGPEELNENKRQIVEVLLSFKINIQKIKATVGPTITLYEIVPAPGVRISKIKQLSDDIALSLSALGIRIIAPIPGRGSIGIEVPNKNRQIVPLYDVLASKKYQDAKMELPIALGKTISNETLVVDLAKMPHLLVAGATGQGKSVGINTIIMGLLYRKHPAEVKLVMVDPKKVELSLYSRLERHFLTYMPDQEEPIITENEKVIHTLNSLCIEMDQRYSLLKEAEVRNIREYNAKFIERRLSPKNGHKYLPYIVMIIDEFADLIMTAGKDVEIPIARIAQLARAVGMHLIIATQRPTVKIITGTIKANFPARLAFKVTSGVDSKTILDGPGAEQLIGMGDMLLSMGAEKVRVQCAFVDTPEVSNVLEFISDQNALPRAYLLPEYVAEGGEGDYTSEALTPQDADELLRDAAHMVVDNSIGSTSMLQRRMKIGYNRAGRIMDELCQLGIVGEPRGSKPREVMVHDILELENMLELFYSAR